MLGVAAYALRDASPAIPRPPWAGTGTGPTSDMQMFEYVMTVLPLLPEEIFQELEEAVGRDASPAELQSIVYGARMRGNELADHLIDFTNLDTYTNVQDMAWVLRTMQGLQSIIAMYGNQWEVFHAGVSDTGAPPTLGELLQCLILLDEFKSRIADDADTLENLERYTPVFRLPGGPKSMFNSAYALLWRHQYARAAVVCSFLLSSGNPDRFTIGNSHYWLGHYLAFLCETPDLDAGMTHLVKVHEYPSCLVFVDSSYCEVAEILARRGMTDTALALFSIRIPSVDFRPREMWKAECSFRLASLENDVTNMVRQLERGRAYGMSARLLSMMEGRLQKCASVATMASISEQLDALSSPLHYEVERITQALYGPENGCSIEIRSMLTHAWPDIEEVSEVIVTNRTLSNNVFSHQDRTDVGN